MGGEAVLPDDLIEQILLRFPPNDPARLLWAALVCKHWCHLVFDAGFRRRFLEAHGGALPMLGFLCNITEHDKNEVFTASFVPTSSSCPLRDRFVPTTLELWPHGRGWRALNSRHGRVLLHTLLYEDMHNIMVVWDPITDEPVELPKMPREPNPYYWGWNTAVLCATGGSHGGCGNGVDCHRTPFIVVFVGTMPRRVFVRVYSSEAGAWSEITTSWSFAHDYCLMGKPSALARNMLYFLSSGSMILKYGVTTRKLSEIHLPAAVNPLNVALTVSEDGGLGFAEVVGSRLYLSSSRNAGGPDEDAGWTQSRVIELNRLFSIGVRSTTPKVLGFAAVGAGVIFLRRKDGVFTVDLESEWAMKLDEFSVKFNINKIDNIVPFVSFYTPNLNRHVYR
ncbi:unnamed protein product [Urochloa decumbens]|uniref:F-box domain-containing protein n=1 Tax=Urochloa decumbens TaxID=240449 RepID=A0ABC9FMX7_9POAL